VDTCFGYEIGHEAATSVIDAAEASTRILMTREEKPEIQVTTASLVSASERDSVTLTNPASTPPDEPYVYAGLNDDAFNTTLMGFVEQARRQTADVGLTLYCRILPGLQDAQRRFEEHKGDPNYRLNGCAGIEEYIRKAGLNPATIRKWRQREKERMFLQSLNLLPGMKKKCKRCGQEEGHTATCPKNAIGTLRNPETETEEKILASQCVRMAQTLVGRSVQPLAERVKKVIIMAEAVREAAQGGSYEHVRFEEPSAPSSAQDPVPELPQPPPIGGEPVLEPEPGTLEELRQRIACMADTDEIEKALKKFFDELVAPLLEHHAYAPAHHVSVSVRRHRNDHRDRISVGDWLEYRGRDRRLTEQIGAERSLGRVIGKDVLFRPRVRWYSGGKEWLKPYSLFGQSSVRVLFDFQAAEHYPEEFNSYLPDAEDEMVPQKPPVEVPVTYAVTANNEAVPDAGNEETGRGVVPKSSSLEPIPEIPAVVNSEHENAVQDSFGLPKIEGAQIIRVGESAVLYLPRFVPDPEGWYEALAALPWSAEEIKMYGRDLTLKRETVNFGTHYDYNPNAKPALPWTEGPILRLKNMTEAVAPGHIITQCAGNRYPDGKTIIGVHHDKLNPVLIVSLSFGDQRQMGFCRHGVDDDKKLPSDRIDRTLPSITLEPGSMVLFTDHFNRRYKHGMAPSKSDEPRISVTFRAFAALKAHNRKSSA
jgi:alkylated DNA repair dioxygenase AlkB